MFWSAHMATIASAVNTAFVPGVGDFVVQCSTGIAELQRRGTNAAPWVTVGVISGSMAPIVSNPVAGAEYRFLAVSGTPVVQADQ
jgi:hypothetical protein